MNPGWLTAIEGALIEKYASNSGINRVLEIGSLYGRSTEHIANGLLRTYNKDFKIYCIDPWIYIDRSREHPGELFYKRFYNKKLDENIIHMKTMTREVASFIMERNYGFCFIDGDHETLPTLFDIMTCATRTNTLLIHDYESSTHKEVNEAVDWFLKISGWKKIETAGTIVVIQGKSILKKAIYENKKVPA